MPENEQPSPVLTQQTETLEITTKGPGFSDLTPRAAAWLTRLRAEDGLLTAFIRHTSASLTIQENADPAVLQDLAEALSALAPRSRNYHHRTEGPDDMPAHIKSALTGTSVSVPVKSGRLLLGSWQALYLVEHRDQPHQREVILHYVGTRQV